MVRFLEWTEGVVGQRVGQRVAHLTFLGRQNQTDHSVLITPNLTLQFCEGFLLLSFIYPKTYKKLTNHFIV